MPNLPTQEELELIAFAAGEKDKHRPMISTADAGSDCPSFERLAEIIEAQADKIETAEAVENTLSMEINALQAENKQRKDIGYQRDEARAEVEQQRKHIGGLEYHLDAARGEVGRLKGELREGFDAEGSGIELRRRMDAMGR